MSGVANTAATEGLMIFKGSIDKLNKEPLKELLVSRSSQTISRAKKKMILDNPAKPKKTAKRTAKEKTSAAKNAEDLEEQAKLPQALTGPAGSFRPLTLNSQRKSIRDDDGEKARNEKVLPSESSLSPSPPTEEEEENDDEGKEEDSNEDKGVIPGLPKTSQVSVSGLISIL
ncbi:hypothetical protein B0H14DRAFT_2603541 [Mycena olivaceomarginata]|nr:hypothetical protein B0H14DRAFT_2603541 [Mycena olivaceomarginata]